MKKLAALFCFVLFASSLFADTDKGFSKERLARAGKVLNKLVDDGKLAGGVLLVLRDGKPAFEYVFGMRDKEAGQKMQADTIFRIASQTKAVVSAAALILLEEGKLQLSDPVSKFVPHFAKIKVRAADGRLVDAKQPVTIQHLLTHTSGIAYGLQPEIADVYREKKLTISTEQGHLIMPLVGDDQKICDAMERLSALPFVSQPGEAFVYGFNIDILGCVIERASGVPLDEFLRDRITEPLKMKDTQFFLDKNKVSRLAVVYDYDSAGKLIRGANDATGQGYFVEGPRKLFSGGGGLLSTAQDYARFLEMIRRGGELDGVRILGPRTVALMYTNQVGSLFSPGMGFGLGFDVVERYGASGMMGVGSFGWAGAYGSVYRVDPEARLTIVFMMQQLPYLKSGQIRDLVYTQIYQALMD